MAYLGLLFNALVWGLSWWPLRHLQALGLHPIWATTLFFAMGAVLIGLARRSAFAVLFREPPLLLLAAVAGCTNAAFNWGVTTGDVVRVVLLFYLMPLWAVLLAWFMLDEPVTKSALARIVLALAGAALVLKPAGYHWPQFEGLPDLLGLLGGMGFALTNVLLRQQARQRASARALAMFVGGTVFPGLLGLGLFQQGLVPAWPAVQLVWLWPALALGGAFFLSNLAFQYGAARVPVHLTSVVMLTEVLFASGSAVLFGSAVLTPSVLAGGALIMVVALMATQDKS